jgi:hypothetical protein
MSALEIFSTITSIQMFRAMGGHLGILSGSE